MPTIKATKTLKKSSNLDYQSHKNNLTLLPTKTILTQTNLLLPRQPIVLAMQRSFRLHATNFWTSINLQIPGQQSRKLDNFIFSTGWRLTKLLISFGETPTDS